MKQYSEIFAGDHMLSNTETALAQLGMAYEDLETLEAHIDTIKQLQLVDSMDEEYLDEISAHIGLTAHYIHILMEKYFKKHDIDHLDFLDLQSEWIKERIKEENKGRRFYL